MKTLKKIFICFLILLLPFVSVKDPITFCNNTLIELINKPKSLIVTASMYTTHNDSIDEYTATGFKLNKLNPRTHKFIAISRDLIEQFQFGQKVLIEGIGKYSGIYVVQDLMNDKWFNKIDILRNPEENLRMFYKVKITKLK